MTDILIQKLEEKVMLLLTDMEDLRKEVGQLRRENSALKTEMSSSSNKLQSLLSLLDSLDATEAPATAMPNLEFLQAAEKVGA